MKVLLLFALLLSTFRLNSQVINVESKRFLRDSNGFTGKTDLSFGINQNIQQVIVCGTNVHAQYKHNRYRVLAISDLSFIKAGEQNFVNAGYGHLRYNYKLAPIITAEAFVQAQYNLALLLDRRYLAGTGPRFRIVKTPQLKLYAASLYMFEYQTQNHDSIEKYTSRLSNYLSLTLDYKKIDFTSTIFFQPSLSDLRDHRLANDTSFELEISHRLNFKTGFNLLFDTRQPPGVPALTYSMRNGISLKF